MPGDWTQPSLTTSFALGAAAAALGVLGLAAPSWLRGRRALAGALLLGLASAAAGALGGPPVVWLPALALAAVGGGGHALRSAWLRRVLARAVEPRPQAAVLLAAGCALVAWCLARADAATTEVFATEDQPIPRFQSSLRHEPAVAAWTDRGRPLRLFRPGEGTTPQAPLAALEDEAARGWGPSLRVIRTGPPDWGANCIGWVFTGGRWWVRTADVPLLVEDNGYREVGDPLPGDLVLYRDPSGEVTHAGVVAALVAGGPVLVESKWAWLGRYLHAPADQPYGGRFTYYRSPRDGHLITVLPAGSAPARPGGVATAY